MSEPIHVVFWPYFNGLRDRVSLLEAAFPRSSCTWVDAFENFHSEGRGAVVLINGGAVANLDLSQLNDQIRSFRWVLLISIGDEGSSQHLEWINHPRISIWVQEPKPGRHDRYYRMPIGSLPACDKFLPSFQKEMEEKPLDWFFSGSVRSPSWDKVIQALPRENSVLLSGHIDYEGYVRHLASAKVCPCRPSWTNPETARVYDALEAGCVPIVGIYPSEDINGHQWWYDSQIDWTRYWEYVLGEKPPFPVIDGPDYLAGAVQDVLSNWPEIGVKVKTWWIEYKQKLIGDLKSEVDRLRSKKEGN